MQAYDELIEGDTVGGSRSPSPVDSPPSRSPSIEARDEEYPGRGITPLPTKELWLYRYAYRLQQFGTTVIPLADIRQRVKQLDGTKRLGLEEAVSHGSVLPIYHFNLVQVNAQGKVELRIGEIDMGLRFDRTQNFFDCEHRTADFKIIMTDREFSTFTGKLISKSTFLEIDKWECLRDEDGLLQWRYEDGTLIISQYSTKSAKAKILQKIEDGMKRIDGQIAYKRSIDFEEQIKNKDNKEEKRRIWAGTIEKLQQSRATLETWKQHIEAQEFPCIELGRINISEKFVDHPTKFILKSNYSGIRIISCDYMNADIYQYLLQPDELHEDPSDETKELYAMLKDGVHGTKFRSVTGKRNMADDSASAAAASRQRHADLSKLIHALKLLGNSL